MPETIFELLKQIYAYILGLFFFCHYFFNYMNIIILISLIIFLKVILR